VVYAKKAEELLFNARLKIKSSEKIHAKVKSLSIKIKIFSVYEALPVEKMNLQFFI